MIKLRLSTFKSREGEFDLEINEGELLSQAVERVLDGVILGDNKAEDIFTAVVNGNQIHQSLWSVTKLNTTDAVLVCPQLKKGDNFFRQFLIIGLTVVAAAFLGPGAFGFAGAGLTGIGLGAATAAATIGINLLVNALIPPPVLGAGALNSGGGDLSNSQMYNINGQSNAVKRFGTVAKVYGTHRMFPNLAANPYTDVEVDPSTGELVQYLYAIYDFGFGPGRINDLRIGDTLLSDYQDVSYKIVDPNKPAVNEGAWDTASQKEFSYYKQDVETESLAVVLDGNRDLGSPIDTYQVIRNAASNPPDIESGALNGEGQTITLTLVNTRGLYSYSAQGQLSTRSIDLEVYFSKVGEDNWHAFNDPNYVDDFLGIGGDETFDITTTYLWPAIQGNNYTGFGVYSEVAPRSIPLLDFGGGSYIPNPYNRYVTWGSDSYWGYPAGTTSVIVGWNPRFFDLVNFPIYHGGQELGRVANVSDFLGDGNWMRLTLAAPTTRAVTLFVTRLADQMYSYPGQDFQPLDYGQTGKIFYGAGILGKGRITRADTSPVYSTFRFTPKMPGEYKIRVTRTNTFSPYNSQVSDSLTVSSLQTRFNRLAIRTDKRHLFLEIRIRATNQLNGVISNLSGVVSSVLDVYNGTTWVKQETNNPAWVYCDLLTGEVNKRAIAKSRLHLPSIMEWADFCEETPINPPGRPDYLFPRFQTNFILDYVATLQDVINQITSAAQAGINITDGKYGVLIDKRRDTPVQIFTPRNSKDFASSRVYSTRPHAVKVKFIEPGVDWETQEVIVYDDGYDKNTATEFDELTTFACTNVEQAWRFGRYMIAQNKLRQETISITVDFEHLICTRGDYVQITQDVMKAGGTPARVKAITGNEVQINDAIETGPLNYGYVFRSQTGEIFTDTLTIVNSDTFELDGELPEVGDLIIIGEVGKITYDCIVKSISPNDDLSAQLILVEKADAVYDAESLTTFPDYDPQISNTVDSSFAAPSAVTDLQVTDNFYNCNASNTGYEYYIDLIWTVPAGSAYEYFEIYEDAGRGYTSVGTTRGTIYHRIVSQDNLGKVHNYKVLAVSATGKKIELGAAMVASATPASKILPPSDIEMLSSDITGEVLQLSWTRIDDCDAQEYLIRYSPVVLGASWEASIPWLRVDRNVSLASGQARTGTYLIKAVDIAGNESANAALAITTIPKLFGLNIISEVTDFPALNGTFDQVEKEGDTLVLQKSVVGGVETDEYYSEGYYYYENLLNLEEIYTVRLQSLIQAEGSTAEDFMSNWLTLDTVLTLANAGTSDWDVETQYRSTESFNVIADWPTLSSISQLNEGNEDNFTEWRKFTMGDATARIFQFRLKLISNKASVTPRVFDGTIRADIPDRIESYTNLIAPSLGYNLLYDPAFAGPNDTPNIQISIDGAQSGDYYVLSNKTLEGFKINFFDKNNAPVSRQFDAQVKGYGRRALAII